MTSDPRPPTLIKRYARSRLSDGAAGRYVTLADLRAWKAAGIAFVVVDTETGEVVTGVLPA